METIVLTLILIMAYAGYTSDNSDYVAAKQAGTGPTYDLDNPFNWENSWDNFWEVETGQPIPDAK